MAKKLKVGDTLHGYRITKVFGPGMMAISYAAQSRTGEKVFFKQYKSPAPTVVWYQPFVSYQRELSARVRSGKAANLAVRQLDAFEERWGGPCYFQVYEFVEHGADLQQILDAEREQHVRTRVAPVRDPVVWARHVTWAKVLITAVAALHESKIVHADLKPPNAYLIEDATIGAGYQLKLIDMDFSLLADRRAPWHGFQGYVGSDNYRSPEHLTRGAMPGLASDVFTCGLMLYELLAGEHPYWREDQAEYARLVHSHAAKPPALVGTMPAPARNAEVSALLHRCLSPVAAERPSAAELRAVLSGRGASAAGATAATPSAGARGAEARSPVPSTTSARAGAGAAVGAPARAKSAAGAASAPIVSERLELLVTGGRSLQIGVRTELGKAVMRQFGPEGEFWDDRQCVFEREAAGQWVVVPIADTVNETLVNGRALTTPHPLRQGDLVAVGRQAKGIVKLPVTVRGVAG